MGVYSMVNRQETNPSRRFYGAFLVLAVCFILSISVVSALLYLDKNKPQDTQLTIQETECPELKSIGTLENIIRPIMEQTKLENGNCLAYALYYLDYLSKTNYQLDVRKIDLAGICPIGTKECGEMEGMPHTYLIINGYGGECILDQHQLVCIQIKDE